jgi:glycine/D-amino acid oxidase-like deaminating enzyme
MGRSADPLFVPYIENIFSSHTFSHVKDPFGGLLLRQCGYLNTTRYIEAVRQWIKKDGALLTEELRDEELIVKGDRVIYRDTEAAQIIFCNGTRSNALFNWLPVRPLKGETILVSTPFEENIIVNRGVYMVPGLQQGEWRIGATYNFQDKAPGITTEARTELEEKLNELMDIQYQCVSQEWGFRPTTPDRRPLLGSHPEQPSVIIFNGFGTKGVSLAPYFSDVLIRWMENGILLNKLVDIERYKSVYWTSPK